MNNQERRKLKHNREKAIIVGVIRGDNRKHTIDEHLDELELLAETAGADVVARVTQKLSRINPAYFIEIGRASCRERV